MRRSKRYRYYDCYNAQQKDWQNCETKSVPAQAIESAVLDSIRRISTDPKLAEAAEQPFITERHVRSIVGLVLLGSAEAGVDAG